MKNTKLPLYTKSQTTLGNWEGETTYLYKEFTLIKNELENLHIYLKQTARLSKENGGRVSIAIDGKGVLTLEEGADNYRLISIKDRLGKLKEGKHTISIIANKPIKDGILDIGLVEKKDY